jgi:hypothetical protein
MKNKVLALTFVVLASTFSIFGISSASADCSAEDPCGIWATVDTQGTVTNIIVCQASVCGGGTFGGQTVVPQVAPNPVTHDTTGTSGFLGNPNTGTEVTYSSGTFTITENDIVNRSETEKIVENESTTTTKASVSIPVLSKTFTYNDTIGKPYGSIPMGVGTANNEVPTNLIVKQYTQIDSGEVVDYKTENISFLGQKTESEIRNKVIEENLNLINSKIEIFFRLLSDWLK